MKRIAIAAAALLGALMLNAQTATEDYAKRMELLVGRVGPSGVGVETLLAKWEEVAPEDPMMLSYKFACYYSKAKREEVVEKPQAKFLGEKPLLSLKDSLGNDVNYFRETFFDDEMYGQASQAMDKLIRVKPLELGNRFAKITSLIEYEKESPDMAGATLKSLIDYHYTNKPKWVLDNKEILPGVFEEAVEEYCYSFFRLGTPAGYETFKSVSEKLLSYDPKNTSFLCNIGSYYLAYKKDFNQALKYYNKVLKIDPKNYTASKNAVLACRSMKNTKLEKKYLAMLCNNSPDENEKNAARLRLENLNQK